MTLARQYCQLVNDQFGKLNQSDIPAPAALLLDRGREWTERRPSNWRGTPQACYANAQALAIRRKGLLYAEGYATHIVPVEHAWCVDAAGRVVDPTWDEDEEHAPDYFGMTFNRKTIRRIREVTGESYSLLFTWWKWPEVYAALTRAPVRCLHPACKPCKTETVIHKCGLPQEEKDHDL